MKSKGFPKTEIFGFLSFYLILILSIAESVEVESELQTHARKVVDSQNYPINSQ